VKHILTAFVLCTGIALAQPSVGLDWIFSTGGPELDQSREVVIDPFGNTIVAGFFADTADYDPGPDSCIFNGIGAYDAVVLKLDPGGSFIWAKSFSGAGIQAADCILADVNGNIYVAGGFSDTTDFDPGPAVYTLIPENLVDCFVVKLDPSGNFIWAKSFGATFETELAEMTFDVNDNIIIAGSFQGSCDFDMGPGTLTLNAPTDNAAFILKTDPDGNLFWVKMLDGPNDQGIYRLHVTENDMIYATGQFKTSIDLDPDMGVYNVSSAGQRDIFIVKLDAGGNFQYGAKIGGINDDYAYAITSGPENTIYVGGTFQTQIEVDPGPGTYNLTGSGFDGFVVRLDSSMNFGWGRSFGGTSSDQVNSIAADDAGNLYATGNFTGSMTFPVAAPDVVLNSVSYDFFLLKFNPAGSLDLVKGFGGASIDHASHIILDQDSIVLTGYHHSTTDFNPGYNDEIMTSNGHADVFVMRLNNCMIDSVTVNQTECDSILYNGQYLTVDGAYVSTFENMGGCDSVVTLNLTIVNPDGLFYVAACDSFFFNSTYHTASGVYYDTLMSIVYGCDSLLTLNLTILSPTASIIDSTTCDSLVLNGISYYTPGIYYQTLLNSNGCDSAITINFSVFQPDTSILKSFSSLFSNEVACAYQWLDCNDNYNEITGAVNAFYEPPTTGSFSVQVIKNGCIDTSYCYLINNTDFYNDPSYMVLSGEVFALPVSSIGSCDGYAMAGINDGIGPYYYDWLLQPNNTNSYLVPGICDGAYTLKITDNIGDSLLIDYYVTDSINFFTWYDSLVPMTDTIYLAVPNCIVDLDLPVDSAYVIGITYLYADTLSTKDYYTIEILYFQTGSSYLFSDTILASDNDSLLIYFVIFCPSKSISWIKTFLISPLDYSFLGDVTNYDNAFTIYPNPARDKIYIVGTGYRSVSITDIMGRQVSGYSLDELGIDVSGMARGIYIIHVIDNANVRYSYQVVLN